MRPLFKTAITVPLALLFLGTLCVSKATAQCAWLGGRPAPVQPQHWPGPARVPPALWWLAEGHGADHGIVGFWKTVFVSEGSPGIPDGTVVDFGFAQWHADGTEFLNSGVRPPATGNFCLGVWQQRGPSSYQLNHFGLSWDATGTFIVGPVRLQEAVTLDDSGTHYEGTFTIDQYDAAGALLAHVEGRVTATRVTVETPVEAVL